jgi:hypothetical protein
MFGWQASLFLLFCCTYFSHSSPTSPTVRSWECFISLRRWDLQKDPLKSGPFHWFLSKLFKQQP